MLNCYYGDVVAVIIPVPDDRALPSVTKHYQALPSIGNRGGVVQIINCPPVLSARSDR